MVRALSILIASAHLVLLSACAPLGPDGDMDKCSGECVRVGPLTVSSTMAPELGFVGVYLERGHTLEVYLDDEYRRRGRNARPSDDAEVRIITAATARKKAELVVDFYGQDPAFYRLVAVKGSTHVTGIPIRVSNDQPSFELERPVRGAMLTVGEVRSLAGHVADPLGTTYGQLLLEDDSPGMGSDGSFEVDYHPEMGLNVPRFVYRDRAANEFEFTPAFLVADRYGADWTQNLMRLDHDMLTRLARVMSARLRQIIAIGPVEEPISDSWHTTVRFDGAVFPGQGNQPGRMSVYVDPVGSALRIRWVADGTCIGNIRVDTVGTAESPGRIEVSSMEVIADVRFQSDGRDVEAVVRNVIVRDGGLNVTVGNLPDWIANLAHEQIRVAAKEAVEQEIPIVLTDMLKSVDAEVEVSGAREGSETSMFFRLIDVVPDDSGVILVTEGIVPEADQLGGQLPPVYRNVPFGVPGTSPVGAAISYDLLNQWAFVQWRAGHLKWELTDEDLPDIAQLEGLGEPRLRVSVDFRMPPVISDGGDGLVDISAGEVWVRLRLSSDEGSVAATALVDVRVGAGIRVEAVDVARDTHSVLTYDPTIRDPSDVQIEFQLAGASGIDIDALAMMHERLAPKIAERLTDYVDGILLPELDLGDIGLYGAVARIEDATGRAHSDSLLVSGDAEVLDFEVAIVGTMANVDNGILMSGICSAIVAEDGTGHFYGYLQRNRSGCPLVSAWTDGDHVVAPVGQRPVTDPSLLRDIQRRIADIPYVWLSEPMVREPL